ncbi:hypothetical protein BH20ACI1_BH20ACI1_24310 [soil metagenome]
MKRFFTFIFLILSGFISIEAQTFSHILALRQNIEVLYRKPSKKELKSVAPKSELFERYAEFLRGQNTGLTKLISDSGCADNTKIIVATEECLKYTMPGAGSSYSFRTGNYRIPRLSDVLFTDNSFQASGVLLHGIFVNIGDVALDKITLNTDGLDFLVNFQPEVDYEKAKEIDLILKEGIRDGKFLYRRGLYVVENTTFVLRSIAYAGKYLRAVSSVTYNEFAFDKRRDVIVAFRIVDKDDAGNVTILWKMLANTKSPRVKKPQNEYSEK